MLSITKPPQWHNLPVPSVSQRRPVSRRRKALSPPSLFPPRNMWRLPPGWVTRAYWAGPGIVSPSYGPTCLHSDHSTVTQETCNWHAISRGYPVCNIVFTVKYVNAKTDNLNKWYIHKKCDICISILYINIRLVAIFNSFICNELKALTNGTKFICSKRKCVSCRTCLVVSHDAR